MNKKIKVDKDAKLVTALKVNNQEAFVDLYKKYHRYIFTIVLRSIQNRDDTEDAVQDIMVKLYQGIHKYDPTYAVFKTWITHVTKNHTIDFIRSKSYKNHCKLDSLDKYDWATVLGYHTIIAEENMDIEILLDSINQEEKLVLTLSYLKGYTHPEIAEMLKKPLGSVKSKIYLAIRNIRKNNPEIRMNNHFDKSLSAIYLT